MKCEKRMAGTTGAGCAFALCSSLSRGESFELQDRAVQDCAAARSHSHDRCSWMKQLCRLIEFVFENNQTHFVASWSEATRPRYSC